MAGKITINFFKSPYGEFLLGSFEENLILADWRYRKMRTTIDARIQKELKSKYIFGDSLILEETKTQLTEYFTGSRKSFDLPLHLIGTEFQKRVWNKLKTIPYGTTDSYLGLSEKLGDTKAIRAVASANGANAISIIIPCHRIIGSDGKLTGYAGGLNAKKRLLEHEGALVRGQMSLFDS